MFLPVCPIGLCVTVRFHFQIYLISGDRRAEIEAEGRERGWVLWKGAASYSPPASGSGGMGGTTILRVWGTKQCCERSEQENFLVCTPT